MSNSFNVKTLVVPLHADAAAGTLGWQGDNVIAHIFKAPELGDGGGITILRAYIVDQAAHGSGTAYLVRLLNYGTGGTAVEGTIGSAGGTGDPLAAGVPKAFTLTDAQRFVDAGEWLVLLKDETNSMDPTRGTFIMEYILGN
jgi:hypothetical protein